jgi:hypothetical protein
MREKTKEERKIPPRDKRVNLGLFPLLLLAERRLREERERGGETCLAKTGPNSIVMSQTEP